MGSMGEIVMPGLMFLEGPVWCDDGTVVCTSVPEGALYRIWPEEHRAERIALTGGGANAAAPASDGGFVVTQNGGIDFSKSNLFVDPPPFTPATPGIQRVRPDGSVTYVLDEGFRAPNDLVTASDGTLYFTDPPTFPPPPDPVGRVHALYADGTTKVIASGFHYCNGIGLEPDGTVVIVEGKGLMRIYLDGSSEWIAKEVGSGADGFCLDRDGNFYVAATRDHGIRVVDPSGQPLDFYPIPSPPDGTPVVTNCCFGGADGRTLFATDGIPGQLVAWEGMPVPGGDIHVWPAR
jgi:gluconolactonase